MIRDLHNAVTIQWKTVIAGGRNIRAENRKTFRREKLGLFGFEMKYRLPAGAKKIAGEWQRVRRPRPNRHHNRVGPDFFASFQQDSFYPTARLI